MTELKNILRQFNLFCVNDILTKGNACIDKMFTNNNSVKQVPDDISFPYSPHKLVPIDIREINTEVSKTGNVKTVNTSPIKINKISRFRNSLMDVHWFNVVD